MNADHPRGEQNILPTRNLTGDRLERVDTRVPPLIFRILQGPGLKSRVGRQANVFMEEPE